jgi:hypothetical protein
MTIKTKRHGNMILLQCNGTTLQGLWKCSMGYRSDTFSAIYRTIKQAKEHTALLQKEYAYFGECFND